MKNILKAMLWISLAFVLVFLAHRGWNRYIMVKGKDPGLGVRHLHAQGINGTGVSVAIIDANMRPDHVEYHDQLTHYEELSDFGEIPYEFHGSSVSSILVGKETGVAPGAKLYYFALNFAEATPADAARALRHILSFNQTLPDHERIRVVSISSGWPGQPGEEAYEAAVVEAWKAGVLVINSRMPTITLPRLAVRGVGCPPWKDCNDPRNYEMSTAAIQHFGPNRTMQEYFEDRAQMDRDKGYVTLYVPVDYRTLAGPREGLGGQGYGPKEYYYAVEGGDSWWPPYLSGVLALALQVNPALTPEEMIILLVDGAFDLGHGFRLIAPEKVVELARQGVGRP